MADTEPRTEQKDIAALAKGGRTNFFGFLARLVARIPFLLIGTRLYGKEELGRFVLATIAVELAAQLATLGQKRGLAQQLSTNDGRDACTVADGLLLPSIISVIFAGLLFAFPAVMFPSGHYTPLERFLPLVILPLAVGDVALAALAYRFDIATTVRARAVVEPWTLSIAAGALWFVLPKGGVILAYMLSTFAATFTAFVPLLKSYGLPRGWQPHPGRLLHLAWRNLPLAGADAVEWGTRKIDAFILGMLAPPAAVGVYYVAQQIASLPQKLKTSFEPILGPVITRNLQDRNYAAIARQVCQVGFWISAAQAGIALALGIPGEGVMGLFGSDFVGGTGAMALLLIAEVVAATAVVSEAALIYLARTRNLAISLGTIAFQAVTTVGLILGARQLGLGSLYEAAAAAAALALSLGLSSLLKSRLLASILGEPINNWRWALLWAVVPAVVVGYGATFLPEWAELAFGIPAILGLYCLLLWKRAFGPEDRVLFRKQAA